MRPDAETSFAKKFLPLRGILKSKDFANADKGRKASGASGAGGRGKRKGHGGGDAAAEPAAATGKSEGQGSLRIRYREPAADPAPATTPILEPR